MRIGIDARAASEVAAGRGRYVRELLTSLQEINDEENSFALYCRKPWCKLKKDQRFHWQTVNMRDPLWHVATALHANQNCDVFLSTNSYLTAWFTRIPCVLMTHDMIPFVAKEFAEQRSAQIERLTIKRALRRATHVICNSNATRNDLERLFPITQGKTTTILLAAQKPAVTEQIQQEVQQKFSLERQFVLAAGTIEPRKNLLRLLRAWQQLPQAIRNTHELLLVGPQGWQDKAIHSELKRSDARLLGYVEEKELFALYSLCKAFCYPSLYEGFGLPVLEAMHCGAAVITSNVSSLPEVAGDAAYYIDPLEVDSIKRGIHTVLTDNTVRRQLSEHGKERAQTFRWQTTAQATLATLKDAYQQHLTPA